MDEMLPKNAKRRGRAPRKKKQPTPKLQPVDQPYDLNAGPIRKLSNTRAVKRRVKMLKTDEFGLTSKERVFCDTYLLDPNGSVGEAYKAAKYKYRDDATRSDVMALGKMVFMRPQCQSYIDQRRTKSRVKYEQKSDRVVNELLRCALVDPASLFDDTGTLLTIHEMPEDTRRAISQIDVYTEYEGRGDERRAVGLTTKIKMVDKKGSLDSLARIFGMFQQEKIDVGGVAELMKLVSGAKSESTIGRITQDDGKAITINAPTEVSQPVVGLTRGPLQVQEEASIAEFEPVEEDDKCPPQW